MTEENNNITNGSTLNPNESKFNREKLDKRIIILIVLFISFKYESLKEIIFPNSIYEKVPEPTPPKIVNLNNAN